MVTMNQGTPELRAFGLLSLMNMAIRIPPKKVVKVAKNAQTSVQVNTLARR